MSSNVVVTRDDGSAYADVFSSSVQNLGSISSGGIVANFTNGGIVRATLAQASTAITFTGNLYDGATYYIYLTQDGTGGRVVTWPGSGVQVTWLAGVAPVLQTTAGATDYIALTYDAIVGGFIGTVLQSMPAMITAGGNTGTAKTVTFKNAAYQVVRYTATGNVTFTFAAAPAYDGALILFELTQDATGSRTYSWPANVIWAGGTKPTGSGASAVDTILLEYNAVTSKYHDIAISLNHAS